MNILIGTPSYDNTFHGNYVETLLYCMATMAENGIDHTLMQIGGSLVEMSRNRMASKVVNDKSFTHLLFIDADMGFSPDSFAKLIENSDLHVIGMVATARRYPLEFNVQKLGPEVRPGIHECEVLGTGVMLIRREVLDMMAEQLGMPAYSDQEGLTYQLFNTEVQQGRFIGEDFNFCLKWKELGGKVHAITDCKVSHRGPHEFIYDSHLYQGKKG